MCTVYCELCIVCAALCYGSVCVGWLCARSCYGALYVLLWVGVCWCIICVDVWHMLHYFGVWLYALRGCVCLRMVLCSVCGCVLTYGMLTYMVMRMRCVLMCYEWVCMV